MLHIEPDMEQHRNPVCLKQRQAKGRVNRNEQRKDKTNMKGEGLGEVRPFRPRFTQTYSFLNSPKSERIYEKTDKRNA